MFNFRSTSKSQWNNPQNVQFSLFELIWSTSASDEHMNNVNIAFPLWLIAHGSEWNEWPYLGFPLDNFKLVLNASSFFHNSRMCSSSPGKSIFSGSCSMLDGSWPLKAADFVATVNSPVDARFFIKSKGRQNADELVKWIHKRGGSRWKSS